jgi:hypothetical protein
MTPTTYRRGFYLLVLLSLAMIALTGKLTYDRFISSLRLSFTEDQTAIFEHMRVQAHQSRPEKAVGFLEYVVNYYPSRTKQVEGSRLDLIVERSRQNAIRAILCDLRMRTGRDLGEDPQTWIDEYQPRDK